MSILAPLIGKKLISRGVADKKAKIRDEEVLTLNQKFKYKAKKLNLIKKAGLKNRDKKNDSVKIY